MLTLIALRDISVGDELVHSYTDCTLPTPHRHQLLTDNYGFTCDCDACISCSSAAAGVGDKDSAYHIYLPGTAVQQLESCLHNPLNATLASSSGSVSHNPLDYKHVSSCCCCAQIRSSSLISKDDLLMQVVTSEVCTSLFTHITCVCDVTVWPV